MMERKIQSKGAILIVDDEPDVCYFLKETLTGEGYDIVTTGSGDEALELVKKTDFDLLMVDIRLESAVSGVEVIRQCAQLGKRPKIMVISATPQKALEPVFEQERISQYIDSVLEKPSDITPGKFERIVESVLKR